MNFRRYTRPLAAIAALLAVLAVSAQSPGELDAWQGSLGAADEQLGSGEYYDATGIHLDPGERLLIGISSAEFDPYLIVVGPDGESALQEDDTPGHGLGVLVSFTAEQAGEHLIVVTSAYPGEAGGYQLTIRREPDAAPQADEPAGGPAPEPAVAEPADPAPAGTDPTDAAPSAAGPATPTPAAPAPADSAPADSAPGVPLAGNTWVFQTMAYPSAVGGGLVNEFISGHLTLYPGGQYEMAVTIGEFANRYSGGYALAGERLTLEGYGSVRFAQSGVRLTLWDGAGGIYGLALEGACEGGVCARR